MTNLDTLTPAQIEHRCRLAWRAGIKAAEAGKHFRTNNRPRGTVFYDDWCDGYFSIANKWRDFAKFQRLTA